MSIDCEASSNDVIGTVNDVPVFGVKIGDPSTYGRV